MSCNGCRVLRKGCSEDCMLSQCLQWIDSPQGQANATVFVAKFFGRAGLMSFISAVPRDQRPAAFQSLLYEAVGRETNPVSGAVGLLGTGNWHVCQAAVADVLHGGTVQSSEDGGLRLNGDINVSDPSGRSIRQRHHLARATLKRKRPKGYNVTTEFGPSDDDHLELCLKPYPSPEGEKPLEATTSRSEESGTTTLGTTETPGRDSWQYSGGLQGGERKMLKLLV